MYIVNDNKSVMAFLPIDGAGSDIEAGALLTRGSTIPNQGGTLILSPATGLDSVAICGSLHDFSVVGDTTPESGTAAFVRQKVQLLLPGALVAAELRDNADADIPVTSATSTAITIASGEDDTDGAWFFVRAGFGVGQLQYVEAATTTVLTTQAMTTTLDSTSLIIRLNPLFHQTVHTDATRRFISSQVAAGSLVWTVLRNQVKLGGSEGWVDLDPAAHNGLDGQNIIGFGLRQILIPVDTAFNPGT